MPVLAADDAVTQCDVLAAHPDDPAAASRGVSDADLSAGRVIQACGEASAAQPDLARLHFQLGRGLWAAQRYEEGIEAFLEAGDRGHGGGLAYLGDAALYGVADLEPDPETAKSLHRLNPPSPHPSAPTP